MTLKKAYVNLTITLLLLAVSIILFVLQVSSNYVFWYHAVFYIAIAIGVIVSVFSIVYLSKPIITPTHQKWIEVFDWIIFTTKSLAMILILFMFFFFSSTIKQTSMSPTLEEGNIVIASQFNYVPKQGDIVIVKVDPNEHPGEEEKLLVKRIAGMPGDRITFVETPALGGYQILINGVVYRFLEKEYIARYSSSERAVIEASLDPDGIIKAGEYLVFGDNEANSKDSRNLGTFREEDIIGHVIYRLWPFGGIA